MLTTGRCKLSMAEAEGLRHVPKPLTREIIADIIRDPASDGSRTTTVKLDSKIVSRYFTKEQSKEEVAATIAKALEQYFGKG